MGTQSKASFFLLRRAAGLPPSFSSSSIRRRDRFRVTSFLCDPNREPILKEALKVINSILFSFYFQLHQFNAHMMFDEFSF